MKITAIRTKNFLSHRKLDLTLDEKISVFVGPNGAGKSSILDAVRTLLAGTCRGVPKKDASALATWGSDAFRVEGDILVGDLPATLRRTATTLSRIEDGKAIKLSQGDLEAKITRNPKALDAVLDVWRALDMSPDERKALVFDLAGIEVTEETLAEKGLTGDILGAAVAGKWKRAEALAADEKRACNRAAEEIHVEAPEDKEVGVDSPMKCSAISKDDLEGMTGQLETLRQEAHDLTNRIQAANAREEVGIETLRQARDEKKEELGEIDEEGITARAAETTKALEEERELKRGIDDALSALEGEHGVARRDRDTARADLHSLKRAAAKHSCPDCGDEHEPPNPPSQDDLDTTKGIMGAAETEIVKLGAMIEDGGKSLETAQANIAKLTAAKSDLDETLNAAERIRRGIAEWDTKIAALEAEQPEDPAALEKTLADIRGRIETGAGIVEAVEGYRKALASAKDSEDRRSALLHEGAAWGRQELLCRPDGIQQELLGPALEPIQDRLRRWDSFAGRVVVDEDFRVEVSRGGDFVDPDLLSSSERWRVGLALADALAQLSGLRFLALDETTLLDAHNRDVLVGSLIMVADDYDQILVCAVLGETPPSQAVEGSGLRVYLVDGEGVAPVPAAEMAVAG